MMGGGLVPLTLQAFLKAIAKADPAMPAPDTQMRLPAAAAGAEVLKLNTSRLGLSSVNVEGRIDCNTATTNMAATNGLVYFKL